MALTDPDAFAADTKRLLTVGGTAASVEEGAEAAEWISIAQAFATPGSGRRPGQFR